MESVENEWYGGAANYSESLSLICFAIFGFNARLLEEVLVSCTGLGV